MPATRNLILIGIAAVSLATTSVSTTATAAGSRPTTTAKASALTTTILAAPDGPSKVGVVDLPMPNAIAFYPAKPKTGSGPHPYLDPKLVAGLGLPAQFSAFVTTSQIGAQPQTTKSPRRVVILAPGFGSLIALSTSLAEHLASHGYIVVAVQPDLAAESAAVMPNEAQGVARTQQINAALDLIGSAPFAKLVGRVDGARVAVGGHSYAGSVAFNMSFDDPRVTAVFDLDGRLFGDAATVPTKVPSLVVTSGGGTFDDPVLRKIVGAGTNTVAVGLVNARHSDLTDAAALATILRKAGIPADLGTIGPVATSNTSIIVRRFLDAAMNGAPKVPTAAVLIKGLPATTVQAFTVGQ